MPKYWVKIISHMGVSPEWVKSKKRRKKRKTNNPGTAGGPGGRDRTLAVKNRKDVRKITFFSLFFCCIYLLVMVKKYFAHGSFPELGQKQKTEKKKRD